MTGEPDQRIRWSNEVTLAVVVCTACGCCIGKDDEDWQAHLNWHRLLRNLTTAKQRGTPR